MWRSSQSYVNWWTRLNPSHRSADKGQSDGISEASALFQISICMDTDTSADTAKIAMT